MKLLKKMPEAKAGFTVVMHLSPFLFETNEKGQVCHKVLGYSVEKSTHKPWDHKSELQLLSELKKEIKNVKSKAKRA